MELIFQKAGILSFSNLEEICHAAIAFSSQPIPKGNNVGMITNTGGPAIIATDELVNCGLTIPSLSEKAKSELKQTMLDAASINNPLDVVATAGAEHFKSAFEVMLKEEKIESIYLTFVTPPFVDCVSVAKVLAEISKKQIKPIVCNYITDKQNWAETSKIFNEGGIPCFDYPETAAKALSSLVRYNAISSKPKGNVKIFDDVNLTLVKNILNQYKTNKIEIMSAEDVYSVMDAFKILVAGWKIAKNKDEAITYAGTLGFPIVVKVDSEKIIHKSDVGGVAVNIKNNTELESVINKMYSDFGTDIKFFIQNFLPKGKELIIGAKAEAGVGHLIMFGLGGIFVELLKDVSFNITPVSDFEAEEMLSSIKASKLITGYRGEKGMNKSKIIEIIQRISMLVSEFPEIKELDLNPLFAFDDQICAVDARIIL